MASNKRAVETVSPSSGIIGEILRKKRKENFNKFMNDKMKELSSSCKQITPEEFVKDILESKTPFSTLLVDCRSPEDFQMRKVKNSVNAPLVEPLSAITTHATSDFSKSEGVRILLELCPQLLMYLYQPGYYTDIVLVHYWQSEYKISEDVLNLMGALSMWTGGSNPKTKICFLTEGFSRFALQFPQWTCSSMQENERPIPWTTSGDINKLVSYQSVQTASNNLSEEAVQLMDSLNVHLLNLESAIKATTAIRDLKLKKRSLEAILATVLEEGSDAINEKIEAVVPADVKCPVCYDVFPGEIFQCTNGHCVCSICCEKLTSCPECRVPYYLNGQDTGKIRVRTLERLLETSVKVDCPNECGEKLAYSKVAPHLQICEKGEYADVKKKMRTEIELKITEIGSLNVRLKILSKEMLRHELQWNSTGPNRVPWVPQAAMEKMLTNKIELAKVQTALALEVFMKTPSRTQ